MFTAASIPSPASQVCSRHFTLCVCHDCNIIDRGVLAATNKVARDRLPPMAKTSKNYCLSLSAWVGCVWSNKGMLPAKSELQVTHSLVCSRLYQHAAVQEGYWLPGPHLESQCLHACRCLHGHMIRPAVVLTAGSCHNLHRSGRRKTPARTELQAGGA